MTTWAYQSPITPSIFISTDTMARQPKRRASTGAPRRQKKRDSSSSSRWLHLSAADVSVRTVIHNTTASSIVSNQFDLVLLQNYILIKMLAERIAGAGSNAFIQGITNLIRLQCQHIATNVHNTSYLFGIDHVLHDIPLQEWLSTREYRPRQFMNLSSLDSDLLAIKMTRFSVVRLHRIYDCFGLYNYCMATFGEPQIRVHTGHFTENQHGVQQENDYVFDPEELFLYTLCVITSGMFKYRIVDMFFGGAYSRWSFGYRWMLRHLSQRYASIMGFQSLLRWKPHFRRFHEAIENFCRRERQVEQVDGSWRTIEPLDHLPYYLFGFIDDTIDQLRTPFSGPRGDYVGASRKPAYADGQRSVYTGYIHTHGLKLETVLLPNGISVFFGPVSARCGDRGVMGQSGLDAFLATLQMNDPTVYKLLGDSIFYGNLQCVVTYFKEGQGIPLTEAEKLCNKWMVICRETIEKKFAMDSNICRCCDTAQTQGRLAAQKPYALEQLQVSVLISNIYVCLNGSTVGSVNTFDLSPPSLEDYLSV